MIIAADARIYAYAAGILDGEGTVTLVSQGQRSGHPLLAPKLLVTSTNREMLSFLCQQFGGRIHKASHALIQQGAGLWKESLTWRLYGSKIISSLLRSLYPYLIIKRPQASLLLRYIEESEVYDYKKRSLTPGEWKRRVEIKAQMMRLNQRGRTEEFVTIPDAVLPIANISVDQQTSLYAYLAGMIDGEGTLTIPRRQAGLGGRTVRLHDSYLCPFVMVSSTTLPVLSYLRAVFGGKVYIERAGKREILGHRRSGYWYENRAKQIQALLTSCLPFLIIKKPHAEVLIEFVSGTQRQGRYLAPDEFARREGLKDRLTALNRKGI